MDFGHTLIILGLGWDIAGIWLIALPLLKKVFKNQEEWDKRVEKANTDYDKIKKDVDNGVINQPTAFDLVRVERYLYRVLNFMYKDNNTLRKLTILGLIVISIGFLMQIYGNILQSSQ